MEALGGALEQDEAEEECVAWINALHLDEEDYGNNSIMSVSSVGSIKRRKRNLIKNKHEKIECELLGNRAESGQIRIPIRLEFKATKKTAIVPALLDSGQNVSGTGVVMSLDLMEQAGISPEDLTPVSLQPFFLCHLFFSRSWLTFLLETCIRK